jgi:glyoxylase-like metal-dependent hydrolase (beta-lactamase superfamily II)
MADPQDTNQVPGLYRRRIGEVLVTAISDGYIDAPFGVLRGIEEGDAEGILKAERRPSPPRISVNCFMIQIGGRTAIVDTGSGDTMGPTLGKLPGLMSSVGVSERDVDTVMLTHMHPDHSNGLTDANGNRLFSEAEIVVDEIDVKHWHDDGAKSRAPENQQTRYFDVARYQLKPYQDRRKTAQGEVFPQVTAVPLSGHTPGHTGYMVESGGEALLIWGDICHVPDIQVRRPEVTMAFDTDGEAAIATRRRTFDMAVADRLLVAGMHLHFPGFAYMDRDGDGYRMIPEAWTFTA